MKKFIVNATKNVGNNGVTGKIAEFLNYQGDAILETNEVSMEDIKKIAHQEGYDVKYNKIIYCK